MAKNGTSDSAETTHPVTTQDTSDSAKTTQPAAKQDTITSTKHYQKSHQQNNQPTTKGSTDLDDAAELEEGPFKGLGAVNVEDVVDDGEEFPHGLRVLVVDLLHHGIQAHTASAPYLRCPRQQAEMACCFHQLQHVVAPVGVEERDMSASPYCYS